MEKVDLSKWDKLSKFCQKNYNGFWKVEWEQTEDKSWTVTVRYANWGVATGSGTSKAHAKAAAANAAWTQIQNGDFIGDEYDIRVFKETTGQDIIVEED